MKKTWGFLFLISCLSTSLHANENQNNGRWALTGGFGAASITWLGPVTTASFKIGAGAEYWFTQNWALGADLGMGSEGYGKVIGTTSQSMINLKTGAFLFDPGATGTFALDPMRHFRLYSALRLGFPIRSGFPGAASLGLTLGTLIEINQYVALDLAANVSAVVNFKGTYLATILTLGSIGFRVFI